MEKFNWNSLEQEAYLKAMIARDEECAIKQEEFGKGHKKGLADGHKKGLADGHKKGLADGREKGLADGKKIAQLEIAKSLIEKCLALDEVAKITKLSEKEISEFVQN